MTESARALPALFTAPPGAPPLDSEPSPRSQEWVSAPAPLVPAFKPEAEVLSSPEERSVLPEERSATMSRLFDDETARGTALRAGAGLLATVPFALAAGHASEAGLSELLGGMLSIPLSLAIISVVGLAASTIGVSLLSRPFSPAQAASVGAHGLLRTGLILLGLAPLTALWVASYDGGEVLVVPTLAWGVAGVLGLSAMNGRLIRAVHPSGTLGLGTLAVIALLTLFTVVLGIRMWVEIAPAFRAANFGEVVS